MKMSTKRKQKINQAQCKERIVRIILCVFLVAFWILSSKTALAVEETTMRELPKYDCVWISEQLKIDAILSEPAWNKAQEVGLLITDTEEKPENPTRVKLLWNDNYLYIGYFCVDPEVWATIDKRDGDLYKEEVVEAFIDADSDLRTYLELEVNPLNALFDAFVLNAKDRNQGIRVMRDWNSKGIKHAVKIDGELNSRKGTDKSLPSSPALERSEGEVKGWTCEIAIPFKDFYTAPNCPPKPGDVWRVNLYRIDHRKDENEHRFAKRIRESEYSAWSTTGKIDFHIPQRFGYLKFVK